MYETTPKIYLKVAELLLETIGTSDFFSGGVSLTDGDVECRLTTTLIVVRDESDHGRIVELLPVWWEFTTMHGAEELCNDFSFNEMAKIANL
jgi:hypothetical protein